MNAALVAVLVAVSGAVVVAALVVVVGVALGVVVGVVLGVALVVVLYVVNKCGVEGRALTSRRRVIVARTGNTVRVSLGRLVQHETTTPRGAPTPGTSCETCLRASVAVMIVIDF